MLAGPLELTRRQKVLVWDDEMEVLDETIQESADDVASPRMSVSSVPTPRRTRSQSSSGDFPPPMRRTSTDASGARRPVPFAAKFQRVHPGTTGVRVLEHLERLDAVEASLERLGVDDDGEEVDVGESSTFHPAQISRNPSTSTSGSKVPTSPYSPPGSPLPTVHEVSSSASSIAEEDLVALSKSTSHVDGSRYFGHRTNTTLPALEWIQPTEPSKRTLIVEVSNLIVVLVRN